MRNWINILHEKSHNLWSNIFKIKNVLADIRHAGKGLITLNIFKCFHLSHLDWKNSTIMKYDAFQYINKNNHD